MNRRTLYFLVPVICLLALGVLVPQVAQAATTGKITGRVIDASTGETLPGVNVLIEGTQRGGTSDADGYYLILSVDPATYRLSASMVGFGTTTQSDVRVQSGFTTTVDFKLSEVALQADELVVVAERPPVEPDKTTSHYVVSSEDVEKLKMVRNITDMIALQPGVNLTNSAVIRGGDSKDGALYVDGVRIQNNDAYGSQFSGINKTSVQEITVIAGGADAEFGNLESGAVSIVTKEGGRKYRGWADYRYTPKGKKHWGADIYESPYLRDKLKYDNTEWMAETVVLGAGADGVEGTPDDEIGLAHRPIEYDDADGHYIEGGASGPIGDQVSFFASARWTESAMNVTSNFPSLTTPFNIRGNAKVTFRPSANVKLGVGQIYSVAEAYNSGSNVRRDLGGSGANIFLPDGSGSGKFRTTDNVTYGMLTHTISPRTFYEIRLSFYSTVQDTKDVTNARDKFGFPVPTLADKDLDGFFNVRPATSVNVTMAERKRLFFKADLSSQVTKGHFVKTGMHFTRYGLYYYDYDSATTSKRYINFVNTPGKLPGEKDPLNPIEFSGYIQDKMEFEGMVLNLGVRFDAFYTNTNFYNVSMLQYPAHWMLPWHAEKTPTIDPTWATVISPRMGVSHPITERSAFHFAAGLYTNQYDFLGYFRERWVANGPDQNIAWDAFAGNHGQNQMANPYIQYQKTRAYEAGADWNFAADYVAGVATYFKSAIAKVGSGSRYWRDPRGSTYVWGLKPRSYQDMKGFELNVRKPFSHYFSFNAAINFGWATHAYVGSNSTQFWPDSTLINDQEFYTWQWNGTEYVPLYYSAADKEKWGHTANNSWRSRSRYIGGVTVDGTYYEGIWEAPVMEFMDVQDAYDASVTMHGDWQPTYGGGSLVNTKGSDQRVQSSMTLYFETPGEFGPGIRNFFPVADIRANMVWHITSGDPLSYTPPGKQSEFRHRPIRTWTDLQVEKTLASSGSRDAIAYIEVLNLFNQQDSRIPFNYADYVRWGMNTPRPDDADYATYGDYNELTRYLGRPREVAVGLRVSF
jgi:hypothetical protein